jgi:hypothetical protein
LLHVEEPIHPVKRSRPSIVPIRMGTPHMTLGEEKKTDETLTKLAESEVNQHAQAA